MRDQVADGEQRGIRLQRAPAVAHPRTQRVGGRHVGHVVGQGGVVPALRGVARGGAYVSYGLAGFESARPGALSGGMRQRVAFMRTLALDPKAILLDEPFSALDFQTRLVLQGDVRRIIRDRNKSAILVTHDIGEAVAMADRVLVLNFGEKLVEGSAAEVMADPRVREAYFGSETVEEVMRHG